MTVDTFEALQGEISDDIGTFIDELNAQIERIANMLDDAANGVVTRLFGLWPGESSIDKAIDKWNNEIHPAIVDMAGELQDDVWDAIGDLSGRPLNLLEYSRSFNEVKGTIYRSGDMAQKMVLLQGSWSGFAFDNYKVVGTNQDTALMNMSLAMDAGGTLTADVANKILSLWSELTNEFLGWTADLLGTFEKATEADAIITFEVPAMFDLAQAVWQAIIDIAKILADYVREQATNGANGWQQLASGARGFPENKWPMVEEGNSDVINDPESWNPLTAGPPDLRIPTG